MVTYSFFYGFLHWDNGKIFVMYVEGKINLFIYSKEGSMRILENVLFYREIQIFFGKVCLLSIRT